MSAVETYVLGVRCALISPLPFQKGEDEGEGFSLPVDANIALSTPHLSPPLDRGGEETLAAGDAKHTG